MMDVVHVDEKWFNMTKVKKTFYLGSTESIPHRQCKSKTFIEKIMFLAAVARPRWDTFRNKTFDGKLSMWPFITVELAQRASKHRKKGTLITKPVNVTRKEYSDFIINKVIPAIKAKWPRQSSGRP